MQLQQNYQLLLKVNKFQFYQESYTKLLFNFLFNQ